MKSCKVVLEDISSKCVVEKLKMLNLTPEKTHKSNSRHTEMRYFQDLQAKTPIAWGKMNDEGWVSLDSAVFSKLHKCQSLSHRIKLPEDTIYAEGAKIFGDASAQCPRNLSGKNRRTIKSIPLIKLKNSFGTNIINAQLGAKGSQCIFFV